MLTIFTHCKAFRGHIDVIQRNAIASWMQLRPSAEIILFGDRDGTADVARELGILHVGQIEKDQFGAPLLSDILKKTEQLAHNDTVCYANCDIILGNEFIRAVENVNRWRPSFLMVGECWDVDVLEPLAFDEPDWQERLVQVVRQKGVPRGPRAIDFFVFPRGFYGDLPPFALGRAAFDNWLIWRARSLKAPVVDITRGVMAIHQNHDYSHVAGGKTQVREGEEGTRNRELAGGLRHMYGISEATHCLTASGLKFNPGGYFRLTFMRQMFSEQMRRIRHDVLKRTQPMRHRLGLSMASFERLKAYLNRRDR